MQIPPLGEGMGEGQPEPGGAEHLPRVALRFDVAFESLGKRPDVNQDELLYMPDSGVLAVFDALGGHEATKTHNPADLARSAATVVCRDAPVVSSVEVEEERMTRAVMAANETLYLENMEKGIDLASTVAIARLWSLPDGSWKLTAASLGDSRVYRFSEGRLQMLTLDHSLQSMNDDLSEAQLWEIQEHLANYDGDTGSLELTEFEQGCYELGSTMGQALGLEAVPVPRVVTVDVLEGDVVLCLSDGISDNLTTVEMEALIAQGGSAAEIVKRLIVAARARSEESDSVRAHLDDMTIVAAVARRDSMGLEAGESTV